jgi:hypothetical protein
MVGALVLIQHRLLAYNLMRPNVHQPAVADITAQRGEFGF